MKGADNLKNYVDKNALQDYTTKLIAKEKTIFATKDEVGSPLVASTVAEMTDENKIYVYVGSETGYTSGNWYYWDGSAWTSGGIYNSEGFVLDSSLTSATEPAQAKAVGDKSFLKRGQISSSSDIDTLYTPGFYFASAGNFPANWPLTAGGNLLVFSANSVENPSRKLQVIWGGSSFRFRAGTTSGGTWVWTDWNDMYGNVSTLLSDVSTLQSDVTGLSSALITKGFISSTTDIDTIYDPGAYYVAGGSEPTNWPLTSGGADFIVFDASGTETPARKIQIVMGSTTFMWRSGISSSGNWVWSDWNRLSTRIADLETADTNAVIFRSTLSSSDDVDAITTPGVWSVTNSGGNTWIPSNWPLTSGGQLFVFGPNSSTKLRKVQMFTNGSKLLYRCGISSSKWGEMRTVYDANATGGETTFPDYNNSYIKLLAKRIEALEALSNIDPIPSYYQDYIASKAATLTSMIPSSGGQFVFITDTHINGYKSSGGNKMHSHALINYLTQHVTGLADVIDGGDMISGANSVPKNINNLSQGAEYTKPDNESIRLYTGGNHDLGRNSTDSTGIIKNDVLAAVGEIFAPSVYGVTYDENSSFQYYLDDDRIGIRYIVLCMGMGTGTGGAYPTSATVWWANYESFGNCADFLASALNSTPSGYHVVVINHYSGIPDGKAQYGTNFASITQWTEDETDVINWKGRLFRDYLYRMLVAYKKKTSYTINIDIDAYNANTNATMRTEAASGNGNSYDFTNSNGYPACMIFGHQHRDVTGNTKEIMLDDGTTPIDDTTDGIPLFVTTTDNMGGSFATSDPNDGSVREAGTVTEQAFDVFTVDKDSRKVYAIRIGGGIGDRTNSGNGYSY